MSSGHITVVNSSASEESAKIIIVPHGMNRVVLYPGDESKPIKDDVPVQIYLKVYESNSDWVDVLCRAGFAGPTALKEVSRKASTRETNNLIARLNAVRLSIGITAVRELFDGPNSVEPIYTLKQVGASCPIGLGTVATAPLAVALPAQVSHALAVPLYASPYAKHGLIPL